MSIRRCASAFISIQLVPVKDQNLPFSHCCLKRVDLKIRWNVHRVSGKKVFVGEMIDEFDHRIAIKKLWLM